MQPRRSLRLVAGALVLALPLLGSCGFNKATDEVYTPGAGTDDRTQDVDVLSAVIVSAQADSGTFIASLSNNLTKPDESRTLTSVAGAGEWSDLTVEPSDLSIEVPPRGFVNLVDEDPITVHGDFTPGQVAELTLNFDSGDSVTMDVPIVYACEYYEGLDSSASEPSESASPTDSPSAGEVTSSASPSTSTSPAPAPGEPYDCSAVGEG
jgi:hypothetical protein